MKNIHMLPTDKPSRFYNTNTGEYHFRENYVPDTSQTCKNHNIYITSDEEIKEGGWYFKDGVVGKCDKYPDIINGYNVKKIILTTDQDLIKNGVQAIDDEFLEWFVKNPGCEEIEVHHFGTCCGNQLVNHCIHCKKYNPVYKTIIPKEEPKKYPIGGYAPGSYSCKCITCNTTFMGDKRAYQCESCATKIDTFFKSFPSKEKTTEDGNIIQFLLGSCSYDGVWFGEKHPNKKGNFWWRNALRKWQTERMFSEQDMIEFGEWCENLQRDNKDIRRNNPDITRKELLEIWKEQFKNKQQ